MKNDSGELSDIPEKYKKLFLQFEEINQLDISAWKPAHVLGYFVKKYYQTYNLNYQFKFNTPSPSKSFELFQIKRLSMLLSSDPSILKKYIDWAYDKKVPQAKRRLTSISFITQEDLINDYKINHLLNPKIDRATELPNNIKSLIGMNISTYGDLAFAFQAKDSSEQLKEVFNKLSQVKFDVSILERII